MKNEKTAIFTISHGIKGYNIKCKAFNTYNRYNIQKSEIITTMEQLADIFNNVLEIGIMFVVE